MWMTKLLERREDMVTTKNPSSGLADDPCSQQDVTFFTPTNLLPNLEPRLLASRRQDNVRGIP